MRTSPDGTPARVTDWLNAARRQPDTLLEMQVLLARVLEKPRAWLLAHPEYRLSETQQAAMQRLAGQRQAGVPLPYLLGEWEFYGLPFAVSPAVLIPRPETELLVETALAWLRANPGTTAADVGTGSGCIAISLAVHAPGLRLLATDRSRAALDVARANAERHGAAIRLVQTDLLSGISVPLDLVCANLPYIPSASLSDLAVARHEPRAALDGGTDGLDIIRRLLADAPRWLAPGGLLLLEIQFDQGEQAAALAQSALAGAVVKIRKDLAGLDRLVVIHNSGTRSNHR